jgi:glycosyltransferase involved in cell wall biosynthesis
MKVSICIPAYNQTVYLRRTLISVLEQDYDDYEIIITDDTADDSVEKIVDEFDFHGRLKYYKNQTALGTPENWNESIRKATGEYIKIVHHDDYFSYSHSLRGFVKMLDDNPDCDFGFSSSWNLDKDFRMVNQHCPTARELDLIKKSPDHLFFSAIVGAPSATIYRNNRTMFFDNSLKWLVDMDFYIRILKYNKHFIYIDEPLISTVDAPLRVTHECISDQKILINEMIIVLKKITNNGFKDLKFIRFLTYRLISNRITSVEELNRVIIDKGNFPVIVYLAVFLSKFYCLLLKKRVVS